MLAIDRTNKIRIQRYGSDKIVHGSSSDGNTGSSDHINRASPMLQTSAAFHNQHQRFIISTTSVNMLGMPINVISNSDSDAPVATTTV